MVIKLNLDYLRKSQVKRMIYSYTPNIANNINGKIMSNM